MTPTEVVLIAGLVAAGFAIAGLLLLKNEGRETPPSPREETEVSDPVQRLNATLQALRKLSELRDEDNEKDPRPVSRPRPRPVTAPRPQHEETAHAERDLRLLVGEAFSPSAPVRTRDLFAGRAQQMEDLVDTVYERGQHAVIYGERGVGKTSLATVMTAVFDGNETQLGIRVNCDSSNTYSDVWRKVFEEVRSHASIYGGDTLGWLDELLEKEQIVPHDVRGALESLSVHKECVVFIDEFDTLLDAATPRLFADTIKMLSDQLVPATIVLIGVADDLDDLIEEHGSVRRALVQIYMPRMSDDEIAEIVNQGLEILSMKPTDPALNRIKFLSQGFPHYTHLLAQASARSAIDDGRSEVDIDDVDRAATRVVNRVHHSIRDAFSLATATSRESFYAEVLTAAALASRDDRGFFTASAMKEPLRRMMGRTYETSRYVRHLNVMCESERGPALHRRGEGSRVRYRFVDPLLQPFVVMKGMLSGLIKGEA